MVILHMDNSGLYFFVASCRLVLRQIDLRYFASRFLVSQKFLYNCMDM